VPLEIIALFEDGKGKKYEEKCEVWIEVEESAKEPPATITTPAAIATQPPSLPISAESLKEKFDFIEFIGSGAFADVYKVRIKEGEISALKIPKAATRKLRKVFIKELATWLNLRHPNILKIKDYDSHPYPYIELEYAEQSLEDLNLPLELEEAASITFYILDALRYAHSKEIYHRDIKLSNVLFVNGIPKLSDWGLSKLVSGSELSTVDFSPLHAALEFFEGKVSEKSDVFQAGIIMYEMLTGVNPFEAETMVEIERKIRFYNPPKPSEINQKAKPLDNAVMLAVEKDVNNRASIDEMLRLLADYLGITYSRALKGAAD